MLKIGTSSSPNWRDIVLFSEFTFPQLMTPECVMIPWDSLWVPMKMAQTSIFHVTFKMDWIAILTSCIMNYPRTVFVNRFSNRVEGCQSLPQFPSSGTNPHSIPHTNDLHDNLLTTQTQTSLTTQRNDTNFFKLASLHATSST